MNLSLFIANRLALNEKKSFSRFIIRLSVVAVALSVAVMIIGSAVTRGYQQVISRKFYDCWGHLHITHFLPEAGSLLNDEKMPRDTTLLRQLRETPGVVSAEPYTVQSALLKTGRDMEGLLLKGIEREQAFKAMTPYLVSGEPLSFSDTGNLHPILISTYTANRLGLKAGEKVILYFLQRDQEQPRARRAIIRGIYRTGLEEYDRMFGVCSSRLLQEIDPEEGEWIQGYELHLSDPTQANAIGDRIHRDLLTPPLEAYPIEKRFPTVFSWLGMMRMNERIVLMIMTAIAVINMITALLILILERTAMVGMLKALGMRNGSIRRIFLISSLQIAGLGALIGTVFGVGLCWVQQQTGFIGLDESTYYVRQVPVSLDPLIITGIVVLTLLCCLVLLMIPSFLIRTIRPVQALRFS